VAPETISEATAVIRGKTVRFAARRLKDGTVALYRNGRRAWNAYQRRLARGVLEGKTMAQATGRKPTDAAWRPKYLGREGIRQNLARYAGPGARDPGSGKYGTTGHEGDATSDVPWAEPPDRADGAFEQRRYYALVSIQVQSAIEAGSDIAHDEGATCTPATLAILKNRGGQLTGLTRAEFKREFETLLHDALRRAGLRLCTGDPRKDVLAIWRHSKK